MITFLIAFVTINVSIPVMGFRRFFSLLNPNLVAKCSSPVNGQLLVVRRGGHLLLNTPHANYSFGSLHRVFQKALGHISGHAERINNVLILGFGAGSIARIIQDELKWKCTITGVEKDEMVIEIGKKYFNTAEVVNTKLVCADALAFTKEDIEHYDLICMDLFRGLEVPPEFLTNDFSEILFERLQPGGIVLYNHISDTYRRKMQHKTLRAVYEEIFQNVKVIHCSRINHVIVAEKGVTNATGLAQS